jgi:hypothetical protein
LPDYLLLLDHGCIVMPWNMDMAEIGMHAEAKSHLAPGIQPAAMR